jgi:hypothetical protein
VLGLPLHKQTGCHHLRPCRFLSAASFIPLSSVFILFPLSLAVTRLRQLHFYNSTNPIQSLPLLATYALASSPTTVLAKCIGSDIASVANPVFV